MPTAARPIPAQESSQVRSAHREQSYVGLGSPAKPRAARRSWRVGRSWATGRVDAHGLGKRRPCAASLGEALQDLLPAPLVGDLERDPAVEINPLKRNVRRAALRPPRIGQLLLRRVRDGGAGTQDEGEAARPDDGRFQRAGESSRQTREE
jgi:hypothetical protein